MFAQFHVTPDTIVVGHSSGCGFILKWLSEHPGCPFGKLALVAPYLDPYKKRGEFLQCTLEPSIGQRVGSIDVFYSLDEKVTGVKETKDLILQTYPNTNYHEFADKDHFCLSDIGPTFPELWDIFKS